MMRRFLPAQALLRCFVLLAVFAVSCAVDKITDSKKANSNLTSGNCANPFYPVSPTLKREYRTTYITIKTEPKTYTESFSDVASDSFTLNMKFQDLSMRNSWKCTNEGLASQQHAQWELSGASNTQMRFDTLSQSGVTVPAEKDWHKGFKWSYGFEIASRSGSESSAPSQIKGDIKSDNEIVGEQSVTVPAGTFSAFRVESTLTQHTVASRGPSLPSYPMNNTTKVTLWYARGTGLVKTSYEGVATTELVSFAK